MKIFAFIFVRGGSKGLPRKNLLEINQIPLVAHSIECAKSIQSITDVFVSSDSDEILSVAKAYGAFVIKRPDDLASDDSPEWLSWQHAVSYVLDTYGEFDLFVSLPATSPTRTPEDVQNCISAWQTDCLSLTVVPSRRNPFFNMVSIDKSGFAHLLNQLDSGDQIIRRQDAPMSYDMANSCYVTSPKMISISTSLWDLDIIPTVVKPENSVDIDSPMDFLFSKVLLGDFTNIKASR